MQLLRQVLEAVAIGIGAGELGGDLGAIYRAGHHAERPAEHRHVEPAEVEELDDARVREQPFEVRGPRLAAGDLHDLRVAVAARELHHAQPVAPDGEAERLGVDGDRVAKGPVVGQVGAVEADGHGGARCFGGFNLGAESDKGGPCPPSTGFAPMMRTETIPFHVVTGFLGAGKTTLINRLLRAPELDGALVLVNEWGEIGLDHLLYERLAGDAILVSGGCVCCALRGDLLDALRDGLERRDAGLLPPYPPDRAGDDRARRARADPSCPFRRSQACDPARARRRDHGRRRGQRRGDRRGATRERAPDRARRPSRRDEERPFAARGTRRASCGVDRGAARLESARPYPRRRGRGIFAGGFSRPVRRAPGGAAAGLDGAEAWGANLCLPQRPAGRPGRFRSVPVGSRRARRPAAPAAQGPHCARRSARDSDPGRRGPARVSSASGAAGLAGRRPLDPGRADRGWRVGPAGRTISGRP